ncbi:MAG: NifU family protein [Acidimicrobiales bacterium]
MADTQTPTTDEKAPLAISAEAAEKVLEIREAEDDADGLALRVEVTGMNGVDFTYDLAFEPVAGADDDDVVYESGGLTFIVPANSVEKLLGATLDLPSNPVQGGLVIRNPNRPDMLEGADLELTGSLEEKVNQLLHRHINPSLAAHGGFAELVKVDGTDVHLMMGGGCQGCAMSAATLREGISVMIAQALPEVTDVIDVTDHNAGETPYYS